MTALVNFICSHNNNNNLQQKQQLTTSFFVVKGDRIRDLNGVGKIRNITGAYELNKNEKIKKITK